MTRLRSAWRSLPPLVLGVVGSTLHAQPSTERLWPDRPWVIDVAGGPEFLDLSKGIGVERGREGGRVLAGTVAVRALLAPHVYVGPSLWFVDRHVSLSPYGPGPRTERVSTVAIEAMLGLPVWRQVRLSAVGGYGGAFSVRSSRPPIMAWAGRPGSSSGSGTMPIVGATLEVGALQVGLRALILLGAEQVIPEFREYYPFTIGWRF